MKDQASKEEDEEASDKGAEQPNEESGVTVSEDYQQQAHGVTHKASKHELNHLRGKMNDREDSLREEEMAEKKKNGPKLPKGVPETYDDSGLPKD